MCTHSGRSGQIVSAGFGGRSATHFGVRTTAPVKKLGCSVLKSLIESDKLLVEDVDIVDELITFVAKKNSYEADDGHHDDLAMCMVLFAWLTRQEYFKSLSERDVRKEIYAEEMKKIEENMVPFGFIPTEEEDGKWDGEDRWFGV